MRLFTDTSRGTTHLNRTTPFTPFSLSSGKRDTRAGYTNGHFRKTPSAIPSYSLASHYSKFHQFIKTLCSICTSVCHLLAVPTTLNSGLLPFSSQLIFATDGFMICSTDHYHFQSACFNFTMPCTNLTMAPSTLKVSPCTVCVALSILIPGGVSLGLSLS